VTTTETAPVSNILDVKHLFLIQALRAAGSAKHPWPEYAACEAALESAWGMSSLALKDCNLFGMKQKRHPIYGTAALPTREFLHGHWVHITADFVVYPGWSACFEDRVFTLRKLAPVYPHYAAALAARDGQTYITEVSKSWSTDPGRAHSVTVIHHVFFEEPETWGK